MDLNGVFVIGRLTRDVDLQTTPNGKNVAKFSIATNRVWKSQDGAKQEKTTFVDVTVWGNLANTVSNFCSKGKRVAIQGRLEQDTWEDRETGKKRSKLYVIAENVQFLSPNQNQGNPNNQQNWNGGNNQGQNQQNRNRNQQNWNGESYQNRSYANQGHSSHDWSTPPMDEPPF